MKSHLKLLSIFSVIAYSFVVPGTVNAQLQWTVVTPAPTSNNLRSVIYGNGQYVAVGDSGTILTSTDGIVWIQQGSGTKGSFNSITCGLTGIGGNPQYVAVGVVDSILTSPDGITWTSHLAESTTPYTLQGQGRFICIAYGSNNGYKYESILQGCYSIMASTDGIRWDYNPSIGCSWTTTFNYLWVNYNYNNGKWVERGYTSPGSHPFFGTSEKALSLYLVSGVTTGGIACGTYGNGKYVVLGWLYHVGGSQPTVFISTDGVYWDSVSSDLQGIQGVTCATYDNGQYVAIGDSGTILNSQDGVNWVLGTSGTSNDLNSVTSDSSGHFVAVGNSGTIVVVSPTATKTFPKAAALSTVLKVNARSSQLTISLPSAMLGKAVDLAVYSVSGREIMRKRVNSGAERFTVSVPNLAIGSYVLAVKDRTQKQAVRFVVVR